jgi:hypothetical protein
VVLDEQARYSRGTPLPPRREGVGGGADQGHLLMVPIAGSIMGSAITYPRRLSAILVSCAWGACACGFHGAGSAEATRSLCALAA